MRLLIFHICVKSQPLSLAQLCSALCSPPLSLILSLSHTHTVAAPLLLNVPTHTHPFPPSACPYSLPPPHPFESHLWAQFLSCREVCAVLLIDNRSAWPHVLNGHPMALLSSLGSVLCIHTQQDTPLKAQQIRQPRGCLNTRQHFVLIFPICL